MLRRGKAEGWLQLPSNALLPWAMLNDVTFDRTVPGIVEGKGGALLAKEDLDADTDNLRVLLTVPRDLILSAERVQEHAKVDGDFREVIESLGEFSMVGGLWRRCERSPDKWQDLLLKFFFLHGLERGFSHSRTLSASC